MNKDRNTILAENLRKSIKKRILLQNKMRDDQCSVLNETDNMQHELLNEIDKKTS